MINNPIVKRELIDILRKKQTFVYLFLILTVGVLIFSIFWYNSVYFFPRNSGEMSIIFLLVLTSVEGIVIALFVPMLCATSVNIEYERETWDLLATTPMSYASILLGKFLSPVFTVWILLLAMIPIYSLAFPFGGVSPADMYYVFLVATEIVVISGLIGLFCSLRWNRTIQSISFTYLFCIFYFVGIPLLPFLVEDDFLGQWIFSPLFIPFIEIFPTLPPPRYFGSWIAANLHLSHYIAISLVILVLIRLCGRELQPAKKEKTESLLFTVGSKMASARFFIYTLLCIDILLIGYFMYWQSQGVFLLDISHRRDLAEGFVYQFLSLAVLALPWICVSHFHRQWLIVPIAEISSSPKRLRQYLFQLLKKPLGIMLSSSILTLPAFLYLLAMYPHDMKYHLHFVFRAYFFLIDITLAISVITLFSYTIWNRFIYSLIYGFIFTFIFLFIIPAFINEAGFINTAKIISPFYYVSSHTIESELLISHVIFMIVWNVFLLMVCERKMLQKSRHIEYEPLLRWLLRTLNNTEPNRDLIHSEKPIAFFSDRTNPVLVREIRDYYRYNFAGFLKTSIWILLFGLLMCIITNDFHDDLRYFCGWCVVIVPLSIVPMAANSFRREHDRGCWDLLYTTLLSPRQILNGKLLSSSILFLFRFLVFLSPIILFLAMGETNRFGQTSVWDVLFVMLSIAIPFTLFLLVVSAYISICVNKTAIAYVLSFVFGLSVMFMPALLEVLKTGQMFTIMVFWFIIASLFLIVFTLVLVFAKPIYKVLSSLLLGGALLLFAYPPVSRQALFDLSHVLSPILLYNSSVFFNKDLYSLYLYQSILYLFLTILVYFYCIVSLKNYNDQQ